MTGSRLPGLPFRHRTRNLDFSGPHTNHTDSTEPRSDPDRLTDHASRNAGVKATPHAGGPPGRALTPTPLRRAQHSRRPGQEEGPAPSEEVDRPRSFRNDQTL